MVAEGLWEVNSDNFSQTDNLAEDESPEICYMTQV